MDTKKIEARKVEIELKFNDMDSQKRKLLEQIKLFQNGIGVIIAEQTKLQGAYAEVCNILGLDPKDIKNLTIQPPVSGNGKQAVDSKDKN